MIVFYLSLATARFDVTTGLIKLINIIVTVLIRAVNYFPGYCQRPIKLQVFAAGSAKMFSLGLLLGL